VYAAATPNDSCGWKEVFMTFVIKLLVNRIPEDSVDVTRLEMVQDCVQWSALVSAVFSRSVLIPESNFISKMYRREMGCEDGSEWNWLRIVSNSGI
jgi:hypothetical protein